MPGVRTSIGLWTRLQLHREFTADCSGKNLFDVTISFGATNCALAGQTLKGAAIFITSADGTQKGLLVPVTHSDNTAETFYAGWTIMPAT
jgi:VCBS repeat-containing protein